MVRKTLIALAALAAVTAATATGAFARGGMGGHGGMGGMGHGMGMGPGMAHGIGHMSFAHASGFVGMRAFPGVRPIGLAGNHITFNHVGFHNHFPFRHHIHDRFFFAAAFPYAYPYYDDGCWAQVWTPWGWRWRSLCY